MLREKFPIERARMRLRLTAPTDKRQELVELVETHEGHIESTEQAGTSTSVVIQVGGKQAKSYAARQPCGSCALWFTEPGADDGDADGDV